ncbi:hypothetical protein ASD53_09880 [Lysobacter sp. Root559]|uniref:VOC family protein n=1 Tax=Lysobacter sp. Root559 TaxID=1736559 RepID=UPI0006F1EE71|nr:VOC family protein [Lysobacter sp. Root559]KQZ56803.1 hypothetical protein ASD53_09880 [Lysobacter sp. Root559]
MSTILRHHYVLAVHELQASVRFYVEALDFSVVAEHPGWVFVRKDDCMIMLGECPDDLAPSALGSHGYYAYLMVDHADGYRARVEAHAPGACGPIKDQPWGMREFGLRTADGHRIMIGQQIAGELPASGDGS